jgi:hypothetical protein
MIGQNMLRLTNILSMRSWMKRLFVSHL